MAPSSGSPNAIRFALLGIGVSTLAMCALIWNALTSTGDAPVASAEIDQQMVAESRSPASLNYAFEQMARAENVDAPAGAAGEPLAEESVPAQERVQPSEASSKVKEVWASIEQSPEAGIDTIRGALKGLNEDEEMEAVSLMNLSLQIRGRDAELNQFALSELLAGADGQGYRKSEFLSSAMHVYLSTQSDTREAVQGVAQVLTNVRDDHRRQELLRVVEVYLPNGKAMVQQALEGDASASDGQE